MIRPSSTVSPRRAPFAQFERGMPPASPVARQQPFAQFRYSLSPGAGDDSQPQGMWSPSATIKTKKKCVMADREVASSSQG